MSKLRCKEFFVWASWSLGVLQRLAKWRLRNRAFVLMYHRILPLGSVGDVPVQSGMFVSPSAFQRQLVFLKKHFTILPLAELVKRIEEGQEVGGCCAITFDDGWRDNFTQAFPILQEQQVPATVFLATDFIGTDRVFWPEELGLFLMDKEVVSDLERTSAIVRFLEQIKEPAGTDAFWDAAITSLKKYTVEERLELLTNLRASLPQGGHGRLLMNWAEAGEMLASGLITFGAHTASHEILDQISLTRAEEEVSLSRKAIECELGCRVEMFAYPNGNFNAELQTLLLRQGFRSAVTTQKRWVDSDTPLLAIPRIGMHEDVSRTTPLFLSRILFECF